MSHKNQQLNDLFKLAKNQQLSDLEVLQSNGVNFFKTFNKIITINSNFLKLVNTTVISRLIFINKIIIKIILFIRLTIQYFTPFAINCALFHFISFVTSGLAIHSKAYQRNIQIRQKQRVSADELITDSFRTNFCFFGSSKKQGFGI